MERKDTIQKNVRFSMRIHGRVTSVYLKKSILALFIAVLHPGDTSLRDFIQENIYSIIDSWEGESGKGLSEYISTQMLGLIAGEYSDEYFSILDSEEI